MLHQSPWESGQDFTIMHQLSTPVDDSVERDLDTLLLKAVREGRIVVTGDGQFGVLDQAFSRSSFLSMAASASAEMRVVLGRR